MEYSQLKEKYQFLGEISTFYDTLDEPAEKNVHYEGISSLCDNALFLQNDPKGKYKIFCKKLLKNLLLLADRNYKIDKFIKYCDILYMWMYFEINKNIIPNDITEKLFIASSELISSKLDNKTPCPYFKFNEKIKEPKKLINLRIFNNNIETIRSLLKNRNKPKDCNLKKYVYECIDIYKEMNKTYILSVDCYSGQHKGACDIINEFSLLYSSFIYNEDGIHHKFPELSPNTITNIIDDCQSAENAADSNSGEPPQTDNSIRGVVSPVLSAMAGIPPFLAIIYKVNIIFT
ncbi:hypothetical protein PVIIG_06452 [Plasmodium vivax India VII]|uniref:PIR Superfamily Protein n=1 Tax=Plasmodium vivax India VII TaxID=1077284 RepID=A0A0J9S3G7_PLAVI|nr:hypothetical protein PVIIG_06452 [Plasmodium vivax India VII]